MKIITFILLIGITTVTPHVDYQVSLTYYSIPFHTKEWFISITRIGDTVFLNVKNYKGITMKKKIPTRLYLNLLDFLNRKGIWILQDHYRKNSPNGYYLIQVKTNNYSNSFRVEHGIPLIGRDARYLEILRQMQNTVKLLIYE